MKLRHPRAHPDVPGNPPAKIDVGGGGYRSTRELNDDATFAAGRDVGEHLADHFGVPFAVVDGSVPLDDVSVSTADSGAGTGERSDDGEADESADDGPTCAGTTSNGDPCTRDVDSPGDYCFQHE